MAMFDDPNKELNRLQDELLAAEKEDDLAGLDDLLKDYEPTDMDDFFQEKPKQEKPKAEVVVKRPAAEKEAAEEMSEMLLDEEEDFEDDEEETQTEKPKKEKGVGGLIALCVAETVAIVGLLAWWLLCLR